LKSKHFENYNNKYNIIHEKFRRMNLMAQKLTLTGNYRNHTITLYDVDPLRLQEFKGTISGPIHNDNIDFEFDYALSGTQLLFTGDFYNNIVGYITLIIPSDKPIDLSGWETQMAIPGEFSGDIPVDSMGTCVFSEVMPMKGVYAG